MADIMKLTVDFKNKTITKNKIEKEIKLAHMDHK